MIYHLQLHHLVQKSKLQSVHGNENDLNNAMVFICLCFSHQEAIAYFINKTYNVASLLLLPQWTFEVLIASVGLKYFVGRRISTIGDRWLSVGDDPFMFRVLEKELKSLNLALRWTWTQNWLLKISWSSILKEPCDFELVTLSKSLD